MTIILKPVFHLNTSAIIKSRVKSNSFNKVRLFVMDVQELKPKILARNSVELFTHPNISLVMS